MKRILLAISLGAFLLTGLESCNRKITRVDPDEQIDLSGRWNDTDSRLAAEELTFEAVTASFIKDFTAKHGRKPVVICGIVKNKSHEHINAEIFVKDIEKAFVKRGTVRVVQGGKMREEIRAERADQQNNASQSTMKRFGLETGADFILQGSINSIVDSYKNKKAVFYKIDLEMTHLQTNEKVWFGDKEIKKYVKR